MQQDAKAPWVSNDWNMLSGQETPRTYRPDGKLAPVPTAPGNMAPEAGRVVGAMRFDIILNMGHSEY